MSPDYLALPDEVVAETILWRLPENSIIRCMSVCKSWYSLITNPNFISTHLLRKTLTKNPQFFLCQFDMTGKSNSCLLNFDENKDYFRSMLLHLPIPSIYPNFYWYRRSVNGLICLSSRDNIAIINFFLCNPSIRHFLSIPPPPFPGVRGTVWGFGFDETSQDYKILSMMRGSADFFIYSLSSNCWMVITSPVLKSLTMHFGSVVFVNGRFHWLAYGANKVFQLIVFDLKDETFGQISLPEFLATSQVAALDIMEFGQSSFAIIQYTVIMHPEHVFETHIWAMKENGLVESWMKLSTIRIGISQQVLGFRNEDEIVIRCQSGWVFSRKINNDKSDQLEEGEKMLDFNGRLPLLTVHKYVPSLVLLDKRNNIDVIIDVDVKYPRGDGGDCSVGGVA